MTQVAELALRQTEKKHLLEITKSFKKAHILVVGDFILDQFVWGQVGRISPEAPVPVVQVQRESYMPGGSLNVANNIRALGGTVYPCGVVGRDLAGRMLVKVMRREGIDTGGVIYDRMRPTSLKTRVIAHSQQVVRFDREKTDEITPADRKKLLRFLAQRIALVDVVIIEDYGKGVIQPALLKQIVKLARQHRKVIIVDPKDRHFSYYRGVTVLTPNRSEAHAAVENGAIHSNHRQRTVTQIGRMLLRKVGCKAVLMTLGEDGMALFERGGSITKIPTMAREVFDVSGAGDTVAAVFGLALASGANMREAAVLANMAAGIVVGKLGTAVVHLEELGDAIRNR